MLNGTPLTSPYYRGSVMLLFSADQNPRLAFDARPAGRQLGPLESGLGLQRLTQVVGDYVGSRRTAAIGCSG